MRVLFYLYPALLSQGPEFNAGWSLLMARLMRGLVDTGTVTCRMITAHRFESALTDALRGMSVGYVDDLVLQREMVASDPLGAVPTEMSRRVRSAQPLQHPNVIRLVEHVQKAGDGFAPDVVITFGMQANYVKQIWPNAPVFHVEATALSRNPYPFSVFFDHLGMYRNSLPAVISESGLPSQSAASYDLLDAVRSETAIALATNDPFKCFDFRHRFERLVLMPLQVSNYYSFDEQANFRTQFELLVQMLSAAPPDVGVIVTEYIQWGEVLNDDGGGANLSWLRRSFPNLIFHEEFRNYDSTSQYLLPHVDGLFTISSNLGYQALLHRKRLVCSPRSHLRSMSHDTNLNAFFSKIVDGKAAEPRDAFLAWYLSHYAVPFELACNGAWLRDYLDRRLIAIGQARDVTEGFVPVASAAVLREHWLNPARAQEPGRFETPKAAQLRARALQAVELANTAAAASASVQMFEPDADQRPGGDTYLLLNDSRSIDGELHWGHDTVTALIEKQMRRMGLAFAGCVNSRRACIDLLASGNLDQVRLAVFNGESSLHHDSERVRDLMSFCRLLKERGIPCVLINSIWHENSRATGELLDAFDIVTVRESISFEAIRRWRSDARLVPDLTFGIDREATINHRFQKPIKNPHITVLDHVEANCAFKLAAFARFHAFPFYLMGRLHAGSMLERKGSAYESFDGVFPQIMVASQNLTADLGCLTGRTHGLVAALCTGRPALALASSTPEIEGMLADVGLGQTAILDARWLNQGHHRQRAMVEQRLGAWTQSMTYAVQHYIDVAELTIDALWKDVAFLLTRRQRDAEAPSSAMQDYLQIHSSAIAIGQKKKIKLSQRGEIVAQGFHSPESWGAWSSERHSQLLWMVDHDAVSAEVVLTVRMQVRAYEGLLSKEPVLRVSSEGRLIGYVFFRSSSAQLHDLEFSLTVTSQLCRLEFDISDIISPSEAGLSMDERQLGFALSELSITAESLCIEKPAQPVEDSNSEFLLWGIEPGPICSLREVRQS